MAWVLARAAGRYGRVCYRLSEFRQSAIECGKYRNSPGIVSKYINLRETPLECQWGKYMHSPEIAPNYFNMKVAPLQCQVQEQYVETIDKAANEQNDLKKNEALKSEIHAMDLEGLHYAKKLIDERLGTQNGQPAEFLYLISRMDKVLVHTNSMQAELNKISNKKGDISSIYIEDIGYINWLTVLMLLWRVNDAWPLQQLIEKISG